MTSLPPGGTGTFVAVAQGAFATGVQAISAGVVWTASGGSITSAGLYTAPTQLGSYQIQATYAGKTGLATANIVPQVTPGALGTASASCANMPLRSTGTIRYFCDCQSGAQAGCIAGSDANPGTSASAPKQTWGAAITAFNAMNAGDTIALCRGGAWALVTNANVPATPAYCSFAISNSRCAAGTSLTDPANTSTCDLRDYTPSWGGTAKPSLVGSGDLSWITRQAGSTNGVRILNLAFQGSNAGPNGGVYNDQKGLLTGICSPGNTVDSDWFVCNNTFDRLRVGIQGPQTGTASNFLVKGNTFTMNDLDAILGFGNGSNNTLDSNVFDNNGGFRHPITGNQAHTVYLTPLSSTGFGVATNTSLVNNQFLRTAAATTPAPGVCATPLLVSHGQFQTLNMENNLVDPGVGVLGSCYSISFGAAGSDNTYYRGAHVHRNLVINAQSGIWFGQAPGIIIENNVISLTGTDTWKQGIVSPMDAARPGLDDVENNATIRNNTIYMVGISGAVQYGIHAGGEGTGHIIANNTVYSISGTCFGTPLGHCSTTTTQQCTTDTNFGESVPACPAGQSCIADGTAYAFIGNEACFGGAIGGTTYDATTHITSNPLFTNPPSDFRPGAGSPLIGAGSAANAPLTDFTLKTRPNPPSIGALEP